MAHTPTNSALFGTSTAQMVDLPRHHRCSISSMGRRPSLKEEGRDIRTTLTILAAPVDRSPTKQPSPLLMPSNLQSPSRLQPSSPGPAPLLIPISIKPSSSNDTMPRQPNRLYSEQDIYTQCSTVDSSGSPEQLGMVRPISEDILLPYNNRAAEVREVLEKPINKTLYGLLKSDPGSWSQITKIMAIDRDIMADELWISELKSLVRPRNEGLWERLRACIGIDSEDAYNAEEAFATTSPANESLSRSASFFSPLLDGDSVLENQRAHVEIRRAQSFSGPQPAFSPHSSTNSHLPPSPRAPVGEIFESPQASPRRHYRTNSIGSGRSERVQFSMTSIAENEPPAFPGTSGKPVKLNKAFLAEQNRQLSQDAVKAWRPDQPPSLISEDPTDDGDERRKSLERSELKPRSNGSDFGPDQRLRGLRFTLNTNAPTDASDCAVDALSDDETSPAHKGSMYVRQSKGPALL